MMCTKIHKYMQSNFCSFKNLFTTCAEMNFCVVCIASLFGIVFGVIGKVPKLHMPKIYIFPTPAQNIHVM